MSSWFVCIGCSVEIQEGDVCQFCGQCKNCCGGEHDKA